MIVMVNTEYKIVEGWDGFIRTGPSYTNTIAATTANLNVDTASSKIDILTSSSTRTAYSIN